MEVLVVVFVGAFTRLSIIKAVAIASIVLVIPAMAKLVVKVMVGSCSQVDKPCG